MSPLPDEEKIGWGSEGKGWRGRKVWGCLKETEERRGECIRAVREWIREEKSAAEKEIVLGKQENNGKEYFILREK